MNTDSSFHPMKNSTNMETSLSQTCHAGAMGNPNHSIGTNDYPWLERRLASSITVSHSAKNNNHTLLRIILPLGVKHPSTGEVFVTFKAPEVLKFF